MGRRADLRWMVAVVPAAVLVLLAVAGCGPGTPADEVPPEGPAGEVVLDAGDDAARWTWRRVDLSVGQVLVVTLASNPTTGYSWQVADGIGTVLVPVGEVLYREAPQEGTPLVGVGGTETFRFEAKAAGQARLALEYRRPWEGTVDPVESFAVEVVVR